eukprot:CAMPEP_0201726456 /NCGR_PEP_ID=MMETSP0593-20130828/9516_1 /ASSEMBLY_ACC=CAM_ASM_000672 /TAXON_ID=267983 /ORGANISM="Skeletonema japonicum, Strain CCMP2506" /LENGTH=42 /DNA_ID= /DNA_START= /DNA_END= /DNA_ORIENTATION=
MKLLRLPGTTSTVASAAAAASTEGAALASHEADDAQLLQIRQ